MVLRAWQVPVAAALAAAIVVLCQVAGDVRLPLPGARAAVMLGYFAPFALCAAVGGMWSTAYAMFEHAGVRRPATLRCWRATASCVLALTAAWLVAHTPAGRPEAIALTAACLAAGLLLACVAPALWWAPALCLTYGYYASRLTFAVDTAAALPIAWALLILAVAVFSVAPDRR